MAQHTNNSNFSLGSFLAGVIVGGAIGAVVGILRAPQSGGETRQQLRKGAKDFRVKADEAISVVQQHGSTAIEEINDHAMSIKNEMKQAIDIAVEEGKAAAKETKNIARKATQDVKDDLEGAQDAVSK